MIPGYPSEKEIAQQSSYLLGALNKLPSDQASGSLKHYSFNELLNQTAEYKELQREMISGLENLPRNHVDYWSLKEYYECGVWAVDFVLEVQNKEILSRPESN